MRFLLACIHEAAGCDPKCATQCHVQTTSGFEPCRLVDGDFDRFAKASAAGPSTNRKRLVYGCPMVISMRSTDQSNAKPFDHEVTDLFKQSLILTQIIDDIERSKRALPSMNRQGT